VEEAVLVLSVVSALDDACMTRDACGVDAATSSGIDDAVGLRMQIANITTAVSADVVAARVLFFIVVSEVGGWVELILPGDWRKMN
jgi:hypothetical protein